MVVITIINSKQIIKQLEADGWVLRGVRGSHYIFKHAIKPGHISVPYPKKLGVGITLLVQPSSRHRFCGLDWVVVEVPVERYFGPAKRVNITLPRLLLAKIDRYAKAHGESRSGFLVEAARSAMR